MIVSLMT